jgi:hypothetical protein
MGWWSNGVVEWWSGGYEAPERPKHFRKANSGSALFNLGRRFRRRAGPWMCHCRSVEVFLYACWMEPGAHPPDIGSTVVARPGPGSAGKSVSRTKGAPKPQSLRDSPWVFREPRPTNHHSITPSLLYSIAPPMASSRSQQRIQMLQFFTEARIKCRLLCVVGR